MRKERVPKLLSAEEARWLGKEDMVPVIPPPQILAIEAKWSKIQLQDLCWSYGIDPRGGDKAALVEILLWAGVLDKEGDLTAKERRK